MRTRLAETICEQNLPLIDFKEYRSTQCASIKENNAKMSLMELAVQQDYKMSVRLKLKTNRKPRVLCINPWINPNLQQTLQYRKIKVNEYTIPIPKISEDKTFNEKENSIQYLKSQLHQLQSPNRKRQSSSKNSNIPNKQLQRSTRPYINSARMPIDRVYKDKLSIRESQLRLLFEPLSTFSNKPQTSKGSRRSHNNSLNRIDIISKQNRSTSLKKRRTNAAKILNFNSKVSEYRTNHKKKFSLFQLLE